MIKCPSCKSILRNDEINASDFRSCHHCLSLLRVHVFPALVQEKAVSSTGETLTVDSEASCFYHEDKKAVVVCDGCGRFLCALCDMPIYDMHLCPECLESNQLGKAGDQFEKQMVRYDDIALATAVIPIIFTVFTVITAPIAIFLVIRYWNTPFSFIPRTKIRFVFAFLIALAQIIFWAFAFGAMISG